MIINEESYLSHYGILRRSGRYPWGSGDNVETRSKSFLDYIKEMQSKGLTLAEIGQGIGMNVTLSTTELRSITSIARASQKQAKIGQAQRLHDKGLSNGAIGKKMGIGESSVRALLVPGIKDKEDIIFNTAEMLKRQVAEKTLIDIGSGVENYVNVGISKEKLNTAAMILKEQGYMVHEVKVPQASNGKDTIVKTLCPPGTTWGEAQKNRSKIRQIQEFSTDGGLLYGKIHDPIAVNPERVSVRYKEDGGDAADGVIYVRPGIEDLSLGQASYAQVRVQVGKDHYLKGMAMYKDDLPSGTDLLFNTNKESTGNDVDAMKPLKRSDPDFPFESVVRQILDDPGGPNERVTSAMNIVYDETNWVKWSRNISSQVLSKQSPALAKSQLTKTQESRKSEFDEIMALTNPTIKKKLLEKFAEGTDAAAVHLKAAALPRSNWHVILPIESMPPSQIYAPGYNNGERVVLIRYPHGGTFEIPGLTVNNKQPEAKKLLGGARAAVGIHHSVAEWLSGADFDGDTVLVIPNNSPEKLRLLLHLRH